ncbi:MAG: glycosyltransferase, partial [Candidatus Omnitrophica bacterium]|nr:glycosyltransferase [Candidatus Omnitrophota bacterium]
LVYTPHGHVFYGYFGKALTGFIVTCERIAARMTERIVGLTPAECEEWLRAGVGRREQYTVIPSGVDFDHMEKEAERGKYWREEMRIPREKVLVGAIGRFIKIKGFEFFIDAACRQIRKRDDIYFVLAGDGPLRKEFEEKIKDMDIEERFRIVGWQEHTAAMIESLDLFVLSSLNEGMGRVLIEAMYFKKPVIATRVGGVPSVLAGGAGRLVEPASSSAISGAIDEVLEDRHNALEMGFRGHDKAVAEYSSGKMIEKLDSLYRELLSKG